MKHLRGLSSIGWLGLVLAFVPSAANGTPVLHELSFECAVSGDNDGCEKSVACPSGTTIRSIRAACNLEYGPVTVAQLARVEQGYVQVLKPSDHVEQGRCWLGNHSIESGRAKLVEVVGQKGLSIGCQEHDRNGGDCQIRGSLSCQ